MNQYIKPALVGVVGVAALYFFARGQSQAPVDLGAPPEISAQRFFGGEDGAAPPTLAGLKGKKAALVEFWATWCGPCRQSIPHMNELFDRYGDRVAVIGLSDEPPSTVGPFVREHGMRYRVGAGSPSAKAYGVRGIPHAFLIDVRGRIVWHGHPLDPALGPRLEKAAADVPGS